MSDIHSPVSNKQAQPNEKSTSDDLEMSDEEGLYYDHSNSANQQPSSNTSFRDTISNKTKLILHAITQGKSLTKPNKELIIKLVKEIQLSLDVYFETKQQTPETINEQIISNLKDTIKETIKQEVSKISAPNNASQSQPTYANALKNLPPEKVSIPSTKPALIVSTKNKNNSNSSAETCQIWKQHVTFKDTNFAPSNVRYVSNNKVCVEFENLEQRDIALNKTNKPNSPVNAEISKKLKPMIMLKGISVDTPTDELADILINQNENIKTTMTDKSDLTFRFKRANKNNKLYNAVFMITPSLWRTIIKNSKVNIDHQKVHVEDFVPLLQCYDCLQFGHTRKNCTRQTTVCSHCSSLTHAFKNCPYRNKSDKICCYNCVQFNKKHNLQMAKDDHGATSKQCPRLNQMIEKTRNRIDYGQQTLLL